MNAVAPFQPIGGQARWQTVYDLLTDLKVGDVLTYEKIGEALDLDPAEVKERHTIQMSMRRAAKQFEVRDKHVLETIPNVGYRVVDPPKHLVLAKQHQRKAGRSLQRGKSKVDNVNLNDVDPAIRSAFQLVAQAFAMQLEFSQRLDVKQDKLEAALKKIADQSKLQSNLSDEEVVKLLARMDRLKGQVAPDDPDVTQ